MSAKIENAVAQSRLFDIKMAARYLSTTVWQMRTLVWEKKVPHIKLGRRFLFDRADLDKFVDKLKEQAA